MSPRLLRIDATRLDAMVFRADSVRFEACPAYRGSIDPDLCECGWLEGDHAVANVRVVSRVRRFPRPRLARVPVRQAS